MRELALHRMTRAIVVVLVVLPALPTIDVACNPHHLDTARAFLRGSVWIDDPSTVHDLGELDGRFFAPFPPLPALLATAAVLSPWPDRVFNTLVVAAAALAVILAGRLGDRWGGLTAGTWSAAALGLGSGMWTATAVHDTYHSAHVLAILAVVSALFLATGRPRLPAASGLALGVAVLARQSIALAALPLAALAGGGSSKARIRRAVIAVLAAAALPIAVYLVINWLRFGSPLATGYELVRHHPRIAADLAVHGAFSTAFVPRNLELMLLGGPLVVAAPPYLLPDPAGMSVLLVSPWLVFAFLPLLRPDRPPARRVAAWCWAAAVAVGVPHLLYVNTGWLQFGYRFALDWLPFLLLAAVLGVRRLPWRLAVPPLVLAIVVNAWGVAAATTWGSWSALIP